MKFYLGPSDKAPGYVLWAATLLARALYAGGLDVGARAPHPMSQTQRSPAEARPSCLAVMCRHCSTFGRFASALYCTNQLPERNQRKA